MQVRSVGAPPRRHLMLDFAGILIATISQRIGAREVVSTISAGDSLRCGKVGRNRQANRIQTRKRNDVAGERQTRVAGKRVVNNQRRAGSVFRLREIALAFQQRRHRHVLRQIGFLTIAFHRRPEERAIFSAVNFRDHHPSTKRCRIVVERSIRPRRARPVQKKVIGQPIRLPRGAHGGAMPIVAAGFQIGIEHATAGAPHLGVISIALQLHLLHRFHRRNDHGAVLKVGNRHAIQQIVIAAHRSTGHADLR